MVTKACDWCKKEEEAFLVFFRPRGWMKHKTPDNIDMVFCSLACFKAFSGGVEATPKSARVKKRVEIEEEELAARVVQ